MGEANAILVSVLVMSYNAEAYIIDTAPAVRRIRTDYSR